MGGSIHEGFPNSWMVFVWENPIYKWMMTGGTPNLGNTHIFVDVCVYIYIYLFTYMYICICIYIYLFIYPYLSIYNCIQLHITVFSGIQQRMMDGILNIARMGQNGWDRNQKGYSVYSSKKISIPNTAHMC